MTPPNWVGHKWSGAAASDRIRADEDRMHRRVIVSAGGRCRDCKARPGDPHDRGCRYGAASDRLRADQERARGYVEAVLGVVALRDTATQLRRVGLIVDDLMEQTYEWARVLEHRADQLEGK